jgi:SNF2 family DNA or RNA helicase
MQGKLYKNTYYQGNLNDEKCETILAIRELSKVESLKHSITELSDAEVQDLIDNKYDSKKNYKYVGTLRDEQTVGTAFMYYAGAALLGDEVGLGKTVEVAGLLNILYEQAKQSNKELNVLFLAESTSVDEIWHKLLQFTGRYIGMLSTGAEVHVNKYIQDVIKREHKQYSVVAPHSVMRSTAFLGFCAQHKFDIVIFDESGALRNNKGMSEIYKNTMLLLKDVPRKILLNATPLEISLRDFYNQIRLLDSTYLPKITEFENLYCVKKKVCGRYKVVGTKNLDVFKKAISLRYFARTRASLGARYEDNVVKLCLLEMCQIQKTLQNRTSLMQQLYDYPPAIMFDVERTLENIPKIWATLHVLNHIDMQKERVLIYCKYLKCQESLKEYLVANGYTVQILNGSTSAKQRKELLDTFKDHKFQILLTNTMRSLDLSYCSHCILYTIDTSPQRAVQVEGRITREFNVVGKTLWLLCMSGREEKGLFSVAVERAKMADGATVQSHSLYLTLLLDKQLQIEKIPNSAYIINPKTWICTPE